MLTLITVGLRLITPSLGGAIFVAPLGLKLSALIDFAAKPLQGGG